MLTKIILANSIFLIGEFAVNLLVFPFLRNRFNSQNESGKFLFLNISVFKGILERILLFCGLILNIGHVLIVFGAIKLGTRIDDKSQKVNNDYFIIGNFLTLLIVFVYWVAYQKIRSGL